MSFNFQNLAFPLSPTGGYDFSNIDLSSINTNTPGLDLSNVTPTYIPPIPDFSQIDFSNVSVIPSDIGDSASSSANPVSIEALAAINKPVVANKPAYEDIWSDESVKLDYLKNKSYYKWKKRRSKSYTPSIVPTNSGPNRVDGTRGNDRGESMLRGTDGRDIMRGFSGHDRIDGGYGNDTLHGGRGHDFLTGSYGEDSIYGGQGDDSIYGGAENDRLFGGLGSDRLSGGPGDDLIVGLSSEGANVFASDVDRLTGGAGADTFRLEVVTVEVPGRAYTGHERAVITDFSPYIQSDNIELYGNASDYRARVEGNDTIIQYVEDLTGSADIGLGVASVGIDGVIKERDFDVLVIENFRLQGSINQFENIRFIQ